jgi:phosphoglycolate phosphatase
VAPSKPHPGMLLQAVEVTGTRPENAAFIGDTTFDMEMARLANLRPIGVAWGYYQAERLMTAGAYRVANHVDDLKNYIGDVLDEHGLERTS